MTASTFPNRPTVEAVTVANAAFGWAFRGRPDESLVRLSAMDAQTLTGVGLAGAMVAAQVEQILAGRS